MPDTIPASAFRLRWQRTYSEATADFTAREGGSFCRIYLEAGGPQSGHWFWTASATHQVGSGHAASPRAAALEAELALLGRSFAVDREKGTAALAGAGDAAAQGEVPIGSLPITP